MQPYERPSPDRFLRRSIASIRYKETTRNSRRRETNIDDSKSFMSRDESVFKQTLPRIRNKGELIMDSIQGDNTNASIDF